MMGHYVGSCTISVEYIYLDVFSSICSFFLRLSDAVDVNLNGVPTSGIQTSTGLEETVLPDSFLQLNHVPSIAAIDSISGMYSLLYSKCLFGLSLIVILSIFLYHETY